MKEYNTEDVRKYNFTSEDRLFLDTNIWFYNFGPQEPKYQKRLWIDIYSEVFKNILNAKSKIYIDVLIISEFINRYARLKYQVDKPDETEFKDFRKTQEFKIIAQDISDVVKQVLKYCTRIESGFSGLDIEGLLYDYAKGDSDFNDQVITELCKNNDFIFVTNDSDFKIQEIPVLTANNYMLS